MGQKKIIFVDTQKFGKDKTLALLTEKLYNMGEKILILTSSRERGEALDDYLWTFKQQSFIPHIFSEEVTQDEPVVLTIREQNLNGASVLILDSPSSFDFIENFTWIFDFVERENETSLKQSRKRFKEYKERGLQVEYREDFI